MTDIHVDDVDLRQPSSRRAHLYTDLDMCVSIFISSRRERKTEMSVKRRQQTHDVTASHRISLCVPRRVFGVLLVCPEGGSVRACSSRQEASGQPGQLSASRLHSRRRIPSFR